MMVFSYLMTQYDAHVKRPFFWGWSYTLRTEQERKLSSTLKNRRSFHLDTVYFFQKSSWKDSRRKKFTSHLCLHIESYDFFFRLARQKWRPAVQKVELKYANKTKLCFWADGLIWKTRRSLIVFEVWDAAWTKQPLQGWAWSQVSIHGFNPFARTRIEHAMALR